MDAVVQQDRLKRIAQKLQEQLQPRSPAIPLQVQCALKDSLMVLVQHPPGNIPNPQEMFETLEQCLFELPNELTTSIVESKGAKVKLLLRVLGQQKPYAYHTIELIPSLIQFDPETLFKPSEVIATPEKVDTPVADEPESIEAIAPESGRLAVYEGELDAESATPLAEDDGGLGRWKTSRRLVLPPWFWLGVGGMAATVAVAGLVAPLLSVAL